MGFGVFQFPCFFCVSSLLRKNHSTLQRGMLHTAAEGYYVQESRSRSYMKIQYPLVPGPAVPHEGIETREYSYLKSSTRRGLIFVAYMGRPAAAAQTEAPRERSIQHWPLGARTCLCSARATTRL